MGIIYEYVRHALKLNLIIWGTKVHKNNASTNTSQFCDLQSKHIKRKFPYLNRIWNNFQPFAYNVERDVEMIVNAQLIKLEESVHVRGIQKGRLRTFTKSLNYRRELREFRTAFLPKRNIDRYIYTDVRNICL